MHLFSRILHIFIMIELTSLLKTCTKNSNINRFSSLTVLNAKMSTNILQRAKKINVENCLFWICLYCKIDDSCVDGTHIPRRCLLKESNFFGRGWHFFVHGHVCGMCGMYVFLCTMNEFWFENVGLRSSSCLLFEKCNSSRTTTTTTNDKVTVKRKTNPNKKESKFLQSTVEIDKSNKQYYNGHQKSEERNEERKKKLMRTTMATPDYGQCMYCVVYMYQYDEGDRLRALFYHSFWHTYFDKLPLFTHF